ncbi:hypothetical protein HPT29_006040 [Microvirga terrae]|uniref:Uncharacterized protein n=1 Tax=Microvirga terrae TaxID=2740529 RepID=A0ABY5RTV1_9HYPH|nr:hypothetical protein [Microvirga terrae]UVF20686.1 hypothetical protein HPT29_006040 [Microvirga terrae]
MPRCAAELEEGITFADSRTDRGRTYPTFFAFIDRPEVMTSAQIGSDAWAVDQPGDRDAWVQLDSGRPSSGMLAALYVQKPKASDGLANLFGTTSG